MSNNRYYYYDHAACTFVEVTSTKKSLIVRSSVVLLVSACLTLVTLWLMSHTVGSPQELALRAENKTLVKKLETTEQRIQDYAIRLDELVESDKKLYRTIFYADPISDDIRQVGVGGADLYGQYRRYSPDAGNVLMRTSETLDRLERKMNLQAESYRELFQLARERDARISQIPSIMPTDGPVVSGHGIRIHPVFRSARMHHGIDIVVDIGTPVHTTADGIVTFSGMSPGYGLNVRIKHPKTGYSTLYAHLSSIPRNIRRGARLERGELIGLSGDTGTATGPHLHYEVRDEQGNSLNPIHFKAPSMTPDEYRRMLAAAEASAVSLD